MLNLLSVGAAYGVLTLIFQHGWLQKHARLRDPRRSIDAWLPLFLFVILFGLSMDYHVFHPEPHREGLRPPACRRPTKPSSHGIKTTAGVITSAALVMVCVFSVFGILSFHGSSSRIGVGLCGGDPHRRDDRGRAILLPASYEAPRRPELVPAQLAPSGCLTLEHGRQRRRAAAPRPRHRPRPRCRSRPPRSPLQPTPDPRRPLPERAPVVKPDNGLIDRSIEWYLGWRKGIGRQTGRRRSSSPLEGTDRLTGHRTGTSS